MLKTIINRDEVNVGKETIVNLYQASIQHIEDVVSVMKKFAYELTMRGMLHDADKLSNIQAFYKDHKSGWKTTEWWDVHKNERHHFTNTSYPEDIDFIDIIEKIVDDTTAGLAREGHVTPFDVSDEILRKAFDNTVKKIIDYCELKQ